MVHPALLVPFALVATAVLATAQTSYRATRHAANDPAHSSLQGGAMLKVPGLLEDFVIAGGGQFVQLPNGTARLTGRVFSDSSIYSAFLIDLVFTGKLQSGNAGFPPAGAPSLGLLAGNYVPAGPIAPSTFVYYTAASGTLTGVRDLDGLVLSLSSSQPVQLGQGANNRNLNDGLLARFAATVTHQLPSPVTVSGPVELTFDFQQDHVEDTTHPQPDPLRTTLPAGRAMVLPGVGSDYVFVPAADFTEYGDGHAELQGTLARISALNDSWTVSLQLQNRVTPGQANHPPTGSPVLQMLPSAYVANGGTMNPAHWHYYTTVTGTLTGTGINQGGAIALAPTKAFQVGGGANQTNTYFGFFGRFAATLQTQPTARTLSITGPVELFGLTAVFPVLPFPSLTVPSSMPSLPTLTDQGIVLQGDNLAWTELVSLNWDLTGGRDASRWNDGWFRVIDNQHVEFHPRPGQAAGVYNCFIFNPAIQTNTIQVQLVAPTVPQLFAEAAIPSFYTTHVVMHSGLNNGQALSIVALSQTAIPSVAPGIASLLIGNQFADLVIDPSVYLHDPVTGIARADYGPIDPALQGLAYWFQSVVIDLQNGSFPLPASNAWRVQF